MENANKGEEGIPHIDPRKNIIEYWLNTGNERDAVVAIRVLLDQPITLVLPKLAKNFSPSECADIVSVALKAALTDEDFRQDIIRYVEEFQAGGSKDTTPITGKDLGVWSRLSSSQEEQS